MRNLRWGRQSGLLAVCALALSACGSPPPASPPPITGVPSASIEVALSNVGCTASGTCLAVGASNRLGGLATVAEDRGARGPWRALAAPTLSPARIEATSCAATTCLVGGAQPTGTFLWRYDATARTIIPLNAPGGAQDVRALSCSSDVACALVDSTSVVGAARLAFTTDAGATWSAPVSMPWTANATVTALACASDSCLVAARTPSSVRLESTNDAGATWTALAVPSAWRSLSDLTCWTTHCAALAQGDGAALVRSRDFGATWTTLALASSTRAVACSNLTRCVVAGATSSGAGSLATVRERRVHPLTLAYVPAALIGAACGAHRCAVIGTSTLVALSN
ncbi:MAG TPA: hypothetical protein VLS91_07545 [Acidimicrobiales bacterium]|nr:hypothetical protein [Acidimicrobiales bacterium]